ncbi:hypothetical protein FQN52_005352 [Onygenales sp. PD_12]|nr:hypothetical protein FQN52_005352 [Onygenales sp. PD_12]
MTRVFRRATSASAVRARSRLPKQKIRKHKIIMESITQEKKKLRSVISFEAKAPPGYTFIPAGNPQFTNACKEMCRKDGLEVFAVSTTPHQRMHDLSQQVHRIGYHFPSVVVATVCMERGLFLSSTGKVVPYHARSSQNPALLRRERRADSEMSQNTINVEAKDAIKDLFPNIPQKDLNRIIKTAFQKGKRKVGTAVELPLARRVQLAVVAHIRHVYTQYDRLLRITSFQDARAAVEEPTLAKLVQWRGDDENGKTVLEDVFREVIVISDDEDDDDDESDFAHDSELRREDRHSSIEIISSNALTGELQTKPVNYGNLAREAAQDFSDDEPPSGFRFIPQTLRRKRVHDKKRPDRRGFSRYQAWDRARDRYRDGGDAPNMASADGYSSNRCSVPRLMQEPMPEPARTRNNPTIPASHGPATNVPRLLRPLDPTNQIRFRQPPSTIDHQIHDIRPHFPEPHPQKVRPAPPDVIQFADGTVFERAKKIPWSEHDRMAPWPNNLPPIPGSPRGAMRPDERKYRMAAGDFDPHTRDGGDISEYQEHVLPSIEVPPHSIQLRSHGPEQTDTLPQKRAPHGLSAHHLNPVNPRIEEVSGKMNMIEINDNRDIFPQKRQRVEYDHIPRGSTPLERDRDRHLQSGRYQPHNLRNPGPSDVPSFHDEHLLRPNERPGIPGRQIERIPAGNKRPLDPIPSDAHFPNNSFDPEQQPRYGGPVLHEPRYPVSSHNLPRSSVVPPSAESAYVVRNDDRIVRPNHISHFSQPQPQFVDREGSVDLRGQSSFRDAGRSFVVAQDSSARRNFPPEADSRISNLHSHDFVRPVHIQDANQVFRYEAQRRPAGPVSPRQPRLVSARADHGAFKAYDRVLSESQARRSRSPPVFQSNSRAALLGPGSAFYDGPGSPPRTVRTILHPSQQSTALNNFRNGQPINGDGRYRTDNIQHPAVIRDDGIRRRPEERHFYYERIPPEQRTITLGD